MMGFHLVPAAQGLGPPTQQQSLRQDTQLVDSNQRQMCSRIFPISSNIYTEINRS